MDKSCRKWFLLAGLFLLGVSVLSAQANKADRDRVRDTLYHHTGLKYMGKITHYKKNDLVKMLDYSGGSILLMSFNEADIDSIGWSAKSRLKFIPKTISFDSIKIITVVHLNDGSVLRGDMLEYRQGAFLRFRIKAGELLIQDADIEKIVQEPQEPYYTLALLKKKKEKVYAFREKGFFNATVFAILPGGGDFKSQVGLSLQTTFGHQFNRFVGLGIGIGIDGYANGNLGDTFVPLFVEARGYLWKKIRTPYWVMAGGYGFPLRNETFDMVLREFDGGYMLHPAIGYRLGGDRSVNLSIDLGYKFQKAFTVSESRFSGDIVTRDVLYQRLSLRMSVIF